MIAAKLPFSSASVRAESERIRQTFAQSGEAREVLSRRTQLVDAVVADAYRDYLTAAFPDGLAVLAVGGYGRQELFPHSDIDILLLSSTGNATGVAKEALNRFQQSIWDAGFRLSHSVRTVADCCEVHDNNIELNVSLLDQRFLAGDLALYEDLQRRLPKFLAGQRNNLARHLARMTHQRHSKFHDTIYHLEPNIKDTPGGIRDLHLIGWLGKLTQNVPEPEELRAATDFLYSVRCFLHYRAARDNNVLNFDAQEELPEQRFATFTDVAGAMREYFRHARAIHRAALRLMENLEARGNSLLAGFRDWRSRLSNNEFTVSRDRVLFKMPQQLAADPEAALRLFQLVARHKLELHGETERRLEEYRPKLEAYFQEKRALWPAIHEILRLPHASTALRAMHDTGMLGVLFPEWREIECYVVRDFHHRYTVDEHTLVAIQNLEELRSNKEPERQRFANLLAEIEDCSILRLALLFHDVGKTSSAASHAEASAQAADQMAERIQMPQHDRLRLHTLVERHLDLSAAMVGRDLDDPATVRWLAERAGTVEVLKDLTLLTYADTGAVHPTALSPWRLEQLWRVYLACYRELTRELETERITADVSGASSPEREGFLKGFPTRYLRIHTEEDIARHMALDERRRNAGIAIDIQRQGAVYNLTVLAKDRLFLFASMAGALASFGMNILKAEAFANQQGTILDTFVFADPQRSLELNPPEMDRLNQTIERVLLGKVEVRALLKNRPKPVAPSKGGRIKGAVTFDSTASETATLVEVVAQDRPGLLYELAAAFSEAGCSIEVVLVDTEAHKALDVFYVTAGGRKLDPSLESRLQEKLLHACSV